MIGKFARTQEWALQLYDAGLIALPCWGGGKALPGTNFRELADNPPPRETIGSADYSGGLSILLGTSHPCGGFVTALDIDAGPRTLPIWPEGLILAEAGTGTGKWHLFLTTQDRLFGQINLRDDNDRLVAEIKGYGLALRSWPTKPPDKPRGYQVVTFAGDGYRQLPDLSSLELAEGLRDYLSLCLATKVHLENHHSNIKQHNHIPVPLSPGLAQEVEDELGRRGIRLRPSGKDGWHSGRCPFHEDTKPSFSVSFVLGAWKCWTGCGSGTLRSLAWRLGIHSGYVKHHKGHLITGWEVWG